MPSAAVFRRILLLLAACAVLVLPARRLAAALVWTPEGGWKIEGGVLSGLSSAESSSALSLMNRARAAEERGSNSSALRTYAKVTKRFPNSIFAPEAFYRSYLIHNERRQYLKGFADLQQIVYRYPNSQRFDEVVGLQFVIASKMLDGARNRGWLILPGFRNREASIGLFNQVLANAPYGRYAPLALMCIAKAYQKFGEYEESIDALERMINLYPKSVLTPDAYLQLAEGYASLVEGPNYDQTSTHQAITYFEDFVILYPNDPEVAKAEKGLDRMKTTLAESKIRLADYYFKYRKNYKAARVFYNEAITDYPDSDVANRSRAQLAKVDAILKAQETAAATGKPAVLPTTPKKRHWYWPF